MSLARRPSARVLVIDDDRDFRSVVVEGLEAQGVSAVGYDPPEAIARSRREPFEFDLVLLDMRLGSSGDGHALTATDVLPYLLTSTPALRVVVFSQHDVSVDDIVECIRRGALGVVPKSASIEDLRMVADVYRRPLGEEDVLEELIRLLWDAVRTSENRIRGEPLEMLVANIFTSMPNFRVIERRRDAGAGEVDVVVECLDKHPFWEAMGSPLLRMVIECRDRAEPAEKADFNVLKAKVRGGRFCFAGIMASISGVSRGFRELQSHEQGTDGLFIYAIDRDILERLVILAPPKREAYLRGVLERQ